MSAQQAKFLDSLVPDHIRCLEPYIPSRPDAELCKMFGCSFIDRLNNNENALGPTPTARRALSGFDVRRAAVYPSGDSYYLRCRLAERFGMSPDAFLVGNGANEVIAFLIHAFCEQGDNIVTADRTFAVYEWVASFSGVEPRLTPLNAQGFDPDALLAAADRRTKVFFICNPNNPTGHYWPESVLREFLRRVDGRAIVVLDEAYAEFVDKPDFPDGMTLIKQYPNLVIFRTFSKIFGLAALRVGFLAGDLKVVDVIRRTCIVYSVNALAQEAAIASLDDADAHIAATRKMVNAARGFLTEQLAQMGLDYISHEGNFLMIRMPGSDTLMYRLLMQQGLMVRTMTGFRFPNYIRVTLGALPVMERLVAGLTTALSKR